MTMFLFKKIVSPFLFPLSICLEFMLLGLLLLRSRRRARLGKYLITIGVMLLLLMSYNVIADFLLRPLEYKYPPLVDLTAVQDVKWIVVLGGGHTSDPRLPALSKLSESALVRLIEAIRIQALLPESRIIVSGGSFFDPVPHAQILADVARSIGVADDKLVLETQSNDTKDEARIIKGIVGSDPFILVTSASHMPRSVALFKKQGLSPVPAPVGYLVKKRLKLHPGIFFPDATGLSKTQRAVYEYLGILWSKIRGEI